MLLNIPNVSETQREKEWVLTEEAFARFLFCLSPDPDQAGKTYEVIRNKLMKIFDWRGARFPEECADETINRVARKLGSGETIRDIPTYCQGVARLVFLETIRKAENRQVSFDEAKSSAMVQSESDRDDARRQCFEKCLSELPIEGRELILQYYEDERRTKINNRQALADFLNIPLNALRNRVQRIRDKLEHCTTKCLERGLSPRDKRF